MLRAELHDNLDRPLAKAAREPQHRRLRWLTDRLFGAHLSYRIRFDADGNTLSPRPMSRARSVGTLEIEFDTRVLGQDFLARSWILLVTGIARTLILAIVLAVVTHLMITRPLAQLVAAVERVDPEAPERLPIRIGPSHERDELGRLGQALDALLARFGGALASGARRSTAWRPARRATARWSTPRPSSSRGSRPDGRLSFVSDAYCRYYGAVREELLGRDSTSSR